MSTQPDDPPAEDRLWSAALTTDEVMLAERLAWLLTRPVRTLLAGVAVGWAAVLGAQHVSGMIVGPAAVLLLLAIRRARLAEVARHRTMAAALICAVGRDGAAFVVAQALRSPARGERLHRLLADHAGRLVADPPTICSDGHHPACVHRLSGPPTPSGWWPDVLRLTFEPPRSRPPG